MIETYRPQSKQAGGFVLVSGNATRFNQVRFDTTRHELGLAELI